MSNSFHGNFVGSFLLFPRSGPFLNSHFAVIAILFSLVEVVFGGGVDPEGLFRTVAIAFGGGETDIATVLFLGDFPVFGGGVGSTFGLLGVSSALTSLTLSLEYCLEELAPAGAA